MDSVGFEPSGVVLASLLGLVVEDAETKELRYLAVGGASVVCGETCTEVRIYEGGTVWSGSCRSGGRPSKCSRLHHDGRAWDVLRPVFGPKRHEQELAAQALMDVQQLADAPVLMRKLVEQQLVHEQALELLSDALGEPISDLVAGVRLLVQQARTSERSLASHVAAATERARAERAGGSHAD